MSIWNAILFGFVQGVTEFLPVSSSAHLSVLSNLFGISSSGFNINAFSVFVHLGTIISVIILYYSDLGEILFQTLEFVSGAQPGIGKRMGPQFPAVRLLVMIFFAFIPVFLVLPFNRYLDDLNKNAVFIGVMLLLSGAILEVADHMQEGNKNENNLTILDAIIVGLAQFVASIPGISRTGTVLTAGLAVGMKKEFAVKFTLILSVPVMVCAEILRLIQAMKFPFSVSDIPACLCGTAAAILAGVFSISVLKGIVKNSKFHSIAYYCFIAGILSIILTMIF